ncbi:MAG TPA: hypothetical protein VKA84_17570 [Gemmatimonadaceae bacterium]|nr:hypothetical protein [Gemmatimonadaceae bacterium]
MARAVEPSTLRGAVAALAIIAGAGCGGDPPAPPARRFSGTFTLREVNGAPPPVQVSATVRNDRQLVGGTITFTSRDRLTEERVFRWVSRITGEPAPPLAISSDCAYEERGDTLIILHTIGEVTRADTGTSVAPGELTVTVRRLELGNNGTFVLRYAAP